ncbi:hypothetical protein DsansV1_C06g0062101 [Dioscorea sansibarensis]
MSPIGAKRIEATSALDAEIQIVEVGLNVAADRDINIETIFTVFLGLKLVMETTDYDNSWGLDQRIIALKQRFDFEIQGY